MNSEYLISFCIPTYNRSYYLDKAIQGIIENSDDYNIEIVISNNASTDNTNEIVSKYQSQSQYPFIRYYINNENVGFDKNVLLCMQRALGQYIWLFGDDDTLKTGAIRDAIEFIKNNNYPTVAIINWEMVDLKGNIRNKCNINIPKDVYTNNFSIYLQTVSNKLAFMSSMIIKRENIVIDQSIEELIGSGFVHVGILFKAIIASPSIAIKAKVLITQTGQERFADNAEIFINGIHTILWSYQRYGFLRYDVVYNITNKIMINFLFHQARTLESRMMLHRMIKRNGWIFLIKAYYRYPLFWTLCLPLILINDRAAVFITDTVIDKIRNRVRYLKNWC